MIGLDQVHTELNCDAILNGEGLFLVSGRDKKLLPGGLVHADRELAALLLEKAVAGSEVELLPALDLVVIEVINRGALVLEHLGVIEGDRRSRQCPSGVVMV